MFLLFIPFYIINSVFISKNQISNKKKGKNYSPEPFFPTIQNQDLNVIKKFYKFLEIFILFGTVSPISAESS